MDGVLLQICLYLVAGVVAAPIASRLGLGSVLGYLLAGVALGPLLGLVGSETTDLQHFAEFGVVVMLFLIGLELEPRKLWRMRGQLLGLGGLQVAATIAAVAGFGVLFGLDWRTALVAGMILALSSTAIVLQTLEEKGLMRTDGGQASFAVLLFQDVAVIPILATIPLLAIADAGAAQAVAHAAEHGGADHHDAGMSLVAGLPGWAAALVTLGSIAAIGLGGRFLARPLFRFIAAARLREIFTAAALLIVVGIALLMTLVGLSPALGAFLAGVVLADSEFRHELESDLEPFKGLLLGLFFITVGAGIDFAVLGAAPATILGLTLGMMALKAAILLALGLLFGLPRRDWLLFGFAVAQAGEFGFVLISFAGQAGALPASISPTLSLIVALSMLLTPLVFIALDRLLPSGDAVGDAEADAVEPGGETIVAGLGRFGQIVNQMLLANGFRTTVLDHRAELVATMARFGVRSFYGDASRPDLLMSAGLRDARALVVAIDDPAKAVEIVAFARRERPDLRIVARARDRHNVYALYEAGANEIIRETFESSLRAGRATLEALGMHPFTAQRRSNAFADYDRETIRRLAALFDPDVGVLENEPYLAEARRRREGLEAAMRDGSGAFDAESGASWTPPEPDGSEDAAAGAAFAEPARAKGA